MLDRLDPVLFFIVLFVVIDIYERIIEFIDSKGKRP